MSTRTESAPSSRAPASGIMPASREHVERALDLEILLVDDDGETRSGIASLLADAGHRVTAVGDGGVAMALIGERVFDAAICDIRLPTVDGLTLLHHIRRASPTTAVILVTGYGAVDDAVASLRAGAHDYLTKPFHPEDLAQRVQQIAERLALRRELESTRDGLASRDAGSPIVGASPAMKRLSAKIDVLARSNAPIVISGESGTGKELVARTIHARSPRRDGPFVAVNCAAFPEGLLEAELFGHERGAFTGSVGQRDGRFKAADRGTLLLDEVGEIPLPAQIRLLRVLQEGAIEPLGTNRAVPVDVRIVAATHKNLRALVASGAFREDLFFRLNVLELAVPPLRERKGDLALLLGHFLEKFTPRGKVPPGLAPRAWAALTQYAYPGNVREFAHAVERSLVLSHGDEIDLEHLPEEIAGALEDATGGATEIRPLAVAVAEFEREYLLRAMRRVPGGRSHAAHVLGISRKTLWEKLRRYNLSELEITPRDARARE